MGVVLVVAVAVAVVVVRHVPRLPAWQVVSFMCCVHNLLFFLWQATLSETWKPHFNYHIFTSAFSPGYVWKCSFVIRFAFCCCLSTPSHWQPQSAGPSQRLKKLLMGLPRCASVCVCVYIEHLSLASFVIRIFDYC